MRADRLLSILMLLQTRGRMTAHDLAEHLEVSERTIYRDFDALSMAGIPLYTERGPGGGCSLIDGYQTRLTGLTEAEIRALFLSTISAPSADLGMGRALEDALLKVSAALPQSSRHTVEHTRQRFYVDTTWCEHPERVISCLQTIQGAVWNDQKLSIDYHTVYGTRQQYLVEPYGLVAKTGAWYLVGVLAGIQQVFHLTRMYNVEATELSFTRPADFDLAACWNEYCTQQKKQFLFSHCQSQQQKKHFLNKKKQMVLQKNSLCHALQKDTPTSSFRTLNFYMSNVILYTRISGHATMSKQAVFA